MVYRPKEPARAPLQKRPRSGQNKSLGSRSGRPRSKAQNRLRQIVWHIPWYGFRTQTRLAEDSGVSQAAISRMMRGLTQPTLPVAQRVTDALSRRLNLPIELRDVFSPDGTYPTPSVCHLTRCSSCLPPTAYDESNRLKPEFRSSKANQWGISPAAVLPRVQKAGE